MIRVIEKWRVDEGGKSGFGTEWLTRITLMTEEVNSLKIDTLMRKGSEGR